MHSDPGRRTFLATCCSGVPVVLLLGCRPEEAAKLQPTRTPQPARTETVQGLLSTLIANADRSPAALKQHVHGLSTNDSSIAVERLATLLLTTNAESVEAEIGRLLESLRVLKSPRNRLEPLQRHLLALDSPLYQGRRKNVISRLRAFALMTLVDAQIIQHPVPELYKHLFSYSHPYEFASAARCTQQIHSREFVPQLVSGLTLFQHHGDLMSLDRYDRDYPADEATTCQLECVIALGMHRSLAAAALPALIELRSSQPASSASSLQSRLQSAVSEAIGRIQ